MRRRECPQLLRPATSASRREYEVVMLMNRPSDPAKIEQLRQLCLSLPEVTEKLSHGEPSWFVAGKQFVTTADHHHDDRLSSWCAAPEGAQEMLVKANPERFFRPPLRRPPRLARGLPRCRSRLGRGRDHRRARLPASCSEAATVRNHESGRGGAESPDVARARCDRPRVCPPARHPQPLPGGERVRGSFHQDLQGDVWRDTASLPAAPACRARHVHAARVRPQCDRHLPRHRLHEPWHFQSDLSRYRRRDADRIPSSRGCYSSSHVLCHGLDKTEQFWISEAIERNLASVSFSRS